MSVSQEGLGRVYNVIAAASGIHIPLTRGQTVDFVSFLDAGTQTVSLTESQSGSNEQALAIIDHIYKAPGVGGAWTEVTQTAAASFDLTTDATNDSFVVTVRAKQLSEGFNSVEATADSGILIAIIYDLDFQEHPTQLKSNIVA